MGARKYVIPEQITGAARKNIAVGLKYARPGDYIDRLAMAKLQQLARGELAGRVIERLESYKKENLSPIKKLAVLLRVLKKLKRKPTGIQQKMADGIIDEFMMDALQNAELSNEELSRLLSQWRR
ncbi:MAG: hypothetical protein HYW05_04360 [Candidatus Diapherotrites archaeon]|nr:hypothetical protein [Candidatus Diapherotrites archaeon]